MTFKKEKKKDHYGGHALQNGRGQHNRQTVINGPALCSPSKTLDDIVRSYPSEGVVATQTDRGGLSSAQHGFSFFVDVQLSWITK